MNFLQSQQKLSIDLRQSNTFEENVQRYISQTALGILDSKIDDMISNCIEKYILSNEIPYVEKFNYSGANEQEDDIIENGQNNIISNLLLCTQEIIDKQEHQRKLLNDSFLRQKAILQQQYKLKIEKQLKNHQKQRQKMLAQNIKLKQQLNKLETLVNIQKLTKNQQLLINQKKINDLTKKINQLKNQNEQLLHQQQMQKQILGKNDNMIQEILQQIKNQERNAEFIALELQAQKISYWELQQSSISYGQAEQIQSQRRKHKNLINLLNQLVSIMEGYPIGAPYKLGEKQQQCKFQKNQGQLKRVSIDFQIAAMKQVFEQYEQVVVEQMKKLTQTILQKTKISEQLQVQLNETAHILKESHFQIMQLNKKYQLLQKSKEQILKQNEILKQQLQNAKHKNMIYLQQLTSIKDKVIGFKDSNLTLQARKQQLMKKLQKAQISFEELRKENSSLKIQIQSLKDSLQTVRKVRRTEDSEQQQEKAIIDQMIEKSYAIRLENRQLKNIHQSNLKQLQELQEFNQKIINLNNNLQVQISSLKQNLKNKDTELQRLSIHMKEYSLKNQQTVTSLRKQLQKQVLNSTQLNEKISILQEQLNNFKESDLIQNDCPHSFTTFRNQQATNQKIIDHNFRKSVGKTAKNIRKNKSISISSINDQNKQLNFQASISLNRTYKFNQENNQKYIKYIANLNEIINYLINYAKGYTKNGYRQNSWIGGAGPLQRQRALEQKNIRMKFQNFEKIRQLCNNQSKCKELIRTFQKIMDYYFRNVTLDASSIDLTR